MDCMDSHVDSILFNNEIKKNATLSVTGQFNGKPNQIKNYKKKRLQKVNDQPNVIYTDLCFIDQLP